MRAIAMRSMRMMTKRMKKMIRCKRMKRRPSTVITNMRRMGLPVVDPLASPTTRNPLSPMRKKRKAMAVSVSLTMTNWAKRNPITTSTMTTKMRKILMKPST